MKILILEDDKDRHRLFIRNLANHDIVIVTKTQEAIDLLQNSSWDVIYLDHDLDGQVYVESGPGTGYEVAEWLSKNLDRKPQIVIVHTFNMLGSENMKELLPEAIVCPGAWMRSIEQVLESLSSNGEDGGPSSRR